MWIPSTIERCSEKLSSLRGRSLPDLAKLVFRKLVYRRVVMKRYAVTAGESVEPPGSVPLEIAFLDGAELDEVLGTSPYLTAQDLVRFRADESVCIVARNGGRIVGSSWMTRGSVFVHELQREVDASAQEHFSSRSYVAPEYRGLHLLGHMLYAYAVSVASPSDRLWCLIYEWNLSSVRAYERVGWRCLDELGTMTLLGCAIPTRRRIVPRPRAQLAEKR